MAQYESIHRVTTLACVVATVIVGAGQAQEWSQWAGSAQHDGAARVLGQHLQTIESVLQLDPFAGVEVKGDYLPVLYPSALIDRSDIVIVHKAGTYDPTTRAKLVWSIDELNRAATGLRVVWTVSTDWAPMPGRYLEAGYQCGLTAHEVWAPGAGGTMFRISRATGVAERINPFGDRVDPTIFVAGSPAIDNVGTVYYNAIQLSLTQPWSTDVLNSWLVRIGADGGVSKVRFSSLTPNAPAPGELCTTFFAVEQLPFPPSPDAHAPASTCGSQRPALNSSPAIARDGTVLTLSRAHFNDRWGYLVAVTPSLTVRWTATLRNRFADGCGVRLPPNGAPGGCREGAGVGVDPEDNQAGSGRIADDSTASPVITPTGEVLYAAYTRYYYAQGHLMRFSSDGEYLGSYMAGWDSTPAIYSHDGTYSIVLKENHYNIGSYCNSAADCPPRNAFPDDPEQYFITQLSRSLDIEWRFRSDNTTSCRLAGPSQVICADDHPHGFDWCVNAIAIDAAGVAYATSADGYVYAIAQGGSLRDRCRIGESRGAAYTPMAIDADGRVFALSDGKLFIIASASRRRAARH